MSSCVQNFCGWNNKLEQKHPGYSSCFGCQSIIHSKDLCRESLGCTWTRDHVCESGINNLVLDQF